MKVLWYRHLILSLKWFILLGAHPGLKVGSSPDTWNVGYVCLTGLTGEPTIGLTCNKLLGSISAGAKRANRPRQTGTHPMEP